MRYFLTLTALMLGSLTATAMMWTALADPLNSGGRIALAWAMIVFIAVAFTRLREPTPKPPLIVRCNYCDRYHQPGLICRRPWPRLETDAEIAADVKERQWHAWVAGHTTFPVDFTRNIYGTDPPEGCPQNPTFVFPERRRR